MDHEAMVRYLAGELALPAAEVERTLRLFAEYLEARRDKDEESLDLAAVVKWIVERSLLPWRQVERTLEEMLALSQRLDDASGPR